MLNRGVMGALQDSGESRTGETVPGGLVRVQPIQFVIGGVLCSFGSSTQGPVGPELGSVTAGKGDSFVRAGLLSVF